MTIKFVKSSYKVLRSLLFTAIVVVVALYIGLYILLSIPPVQNYIGRCVEKELSSFLGGEVRIGEVMIFPFNEVRLKNVDFYTPHKERCITIGTLGAGIHLWRLIGERKIEITYAEILDLDGRIWQNKKDGPFNISYLIDAFAPKEKNKPPTKFDLKIHNIVIRRSALGFDRRWKPELDETDRFDINHIILSDLNADIAIPVLKNDDFVVDLRRLAFKSKAGFEVDRLALKAHITPYRISLKDFLLHAGRAEMRLNGQELIFSKPYSFSELINNGSTHLELSVENFYPADFRLFYPAFSEIKDGFKINIESEGNLRDIRIENLSLLKNGYGNLLTFIGNVSNLQDPNKLEAVVSKFDLHLPESTSRNIIDVFLTDNAKSKTFKESIFKIGKIDADLSGEYNSTTGSLIATGLVGVSPGNIEFSLEGNFHGKDNFEGRFDINSTGLEIDRFLEKSGVGNLAFSASGEIARNPNQVNGLVDLIVDHVEYKGHRLSDLAVHANKNNNEVSVSMEMNDPYAAFKLDGNAYISGVNSRLSINGKVGSFYPSILGVLPKFSDYSVNGSFDAEVTGNNLDNLCGELRLSDFYFLNRDGKGMKLNRADLILEISEKGDSKLLSASERKITFTSDYLNAELEGEFKYGELVKGIRRMVSEELGCITGDNTNHYDSSEGRADFNIKIFADKTYPDFFHIPVKPLKDITLSGSIDLKVGKIDATLDSPYLLQGTSKLISGTRVYAIMEKSHGLAINLNTVYPLKNDKMSLELMLNAHNNSADLNLGWVMLKNPEAVGKLSMGAEFGMDLLSGSRNVKICVNPSTFRLGPSEWKIAGSEIVYSDKKLSVDNLNVTHDGQFIQVEGVTSSDPNDELKIRLADIDLDYIFGILNINYVSFGGVASGEITASSVFTPSPVAYTRRLDVKNLAYNETVLGDADIYSCWNNREKEVEIHAKVKDGTQSSAKIDGGIFVTRDSLSFDMDANKINIGFLKPFMSAFTSDVGGRASGQVKLAGSFKDIDLTGQAYADSIYMKVDYTNVYYHGSDSVFLKPGRIEIPSFRLYDRNGNSADFSGLVKHSYFHDPEFEFRLTNARNLLCYDTNHLINPDWYGTIYASGKGTLKGRPGIVVMEMDMTTNPESDFTFVLNETQTALDYAFLTFSDRRKKALEETIKVEETFEDRFVKKKTEELNPPTVFAMDLRATVTPGARVNLIMDPNAGDKITARGGGPLLIHYDTESDEMTMYGKYTLAEGSYNFSLQELILRSFNIQEGSTISFNGDPLGANLDIIAAYRVNTNLSDLDKSFSTDRDLNRTNVPVDALLKVKGDLEKPDISFDISLPTLTGDVERKVRSIISTDDLMSRQIIYLLALNRFYTPEYMGSTSNGGGELASVASSTISSQLSNMIGQLTDKFTVAPSIRSDKGDFSDMEVDVALSSRLLNNRLLINGNFGYRDKNTSQTTFVGDFDIEYLLSGNGNLRLKAYNHFNDQNYYLKSSLTTQGLGIVYRKEFDNPFTWLRKRKRVSHGSESHDPLQSPESEALEEAVRKDSVPEKEENRKEKENR